MLTAIEYLGKPLTLESLNEALGLEDKKSKAAIEAEKKAEADKAKGSFILFFYDELAAERIERRTRQAREVVYNSLLSFGRIMSTTSGFRKTDSEVARVVFPRKNHFREPPNRCTNQRICHHTAWCNARLPYGTNANIP